MYLNLLAPFIDSPCLHLGISVEIAGCFPSELIYGRFKDSRNSVIANSQKIIVQTM